MNTDKTAASYAERAVADLGQQAHDGIRVAIWCYDNPPRKPLERQKGERSRPVYHSQQVFACALTIAKAKSIETGEQWTVEDVVEALLRERIKELAPNAWELHERHSRESRALLEAMSQRNGTEESEPRIAGVLKSDLEHYENL